MIRSIRAGVSRLHGLRARLGAKWCVVGLLLPPAAFGICYFGPQAAVVLALSVLICAAAGIVPRAICGQPFELFHPGALITGLLLGLTLSADTPIYMIVVGALVAELPGKFRLGWLGRNPLNPAALGRTAIALLEYLDPAAYSVPAVDIVSSASALFKDAGGHPRPQLADLFLGGHPGAIGETSELVLIPMAILMLWFVVVKRHAAVAMILAVPLTVICLPATPDVVGHAPWALNPMVYLLASNTFLLAVFFVTDPVTTPNTRLGGIIFGAGIGVLGVLGRLYTTLPGAEMYAVLIMNLAVPVLDLSWLKNRKRDEVAGLAVTDGLPVLTGTNGRTKSVSAKHAVDSFFEQTSDVASEDAEVPSVGRLSKITSTETHEPFFVFRQLAAENNRDAAIKLLEESGLCGCGGARFPVHLKWKGLLRQQAPRVLIANGQEGEPETFKDRYLMQHHARLVVEGIAIAALVVAADEVIVVVTSRSAPALKAMTQAVADLRQVPESKLLPPIYVVPGPDLYVCGEETALIEFLESNRGEPRLRPPLPIEKGLYGKPTLVQNVETLAWLPSIMHHGAEWFAAGGGYQLVSLSGAVVTPGVYEVASGTPLEEIVAMGGGLVDDEQLLAIAVGGPSGGMLPASMADLPFEKKTLQRAGTMMGTGAVCVMGASECVVTKALVAAEFFRDESCGRCTPCRVGTSELVRLWRKLADGEAGSEELEQLHEVAAIMRRTSTCGLGIAAAGRILSVLKYWPQRIDMCSAATDTKGVC